MFAVAMLLGLAVRGITTAGFPPAIWFGGDSASYLSTGLRLYPGTSRVSGYGVLLLLLRPFRSFLAVVAVQHLMGLAIAVMVYALLRRYGLPGWGAMLATLPVLLDAYQIELEQEILPSTAFTFLVVLAITLVLWWHAKPPRWAIFAAGLAFAIAATFWPVGIGLLALYLVYLAIGRVGWRALGAAVLGGTLPLAMYMLWFDRAYHQIAMTDSDGIFLWSRTMSFANCSVIKPPAAEAGLCTRQPEGQRPAASTFIWSTRSPLNSLPGPKFSASKNALAMDFAVRAIVAQPGGYASAVLHDFALTFTWAIPDHPNALALRRYQFADATKHWIPPGFVIAPGHTVASDQLAYGGATSTRAISPFAGWMVTYQRFIYLPGTLLGVLLLLGLVAMLRAGRLGKMPGLAARTGPATLPWLISLGILLVPVIIADYSRRYTLIAVPAICLAAALAFVPRRVFAAAENIRAAEITPAIPAITTPALSPE